MITVEQIAARLDDPFNLLITENRAVNNRHQSLRAVLDWSYALLSQAECLLFGRLSVFSGGWTLEAAETVCTDDAIPRDQILQLMAGLVDKSLVIRLDGSRYDMLNIIHHYAADKLIEAGLQRQLFRQHLDYYLGLVLRADENLSGPVQHTWIKLLDTESSNFAIALERAFDMHEMLSKGCELVFALEKYWELVGDSILAKYWQEIARAHISPALPIGRNTH